MNWKPWQFVFFSGKYKKNLLGLAKILTEKNLMNQGSGTANNKNYTNSLLNEAWRKIWQILKKLDPLLWNNLV